MAYRVILKPGARKNLDKIPERYYAKIIAVLNALKEEPLLGKKLSGKKRGQYSIPVWPYRIIYRIEKRELVIIVIDIDHRQGVYNN